MRPIFLLRGQSKLSKRFIKNLVNYIIIVNYFITTDYIRNQKLKELHQDKKGKKMLFTNSLSPVLLFNLFVLYPFKCTLIFTTVGMTGIS